MSATQEPSYYVIGSVLQLIKDQLESGNAMPTKFGMSSNVKAIYDSEVEQVKSDELVYGILQLVDVEVDDFLTDEAVYLIETGEGQNEDCFFVGVGAMEILLRTMPDNKKQDPSNPKEAFTYNGYKFVLDKRIGDNDVIGIGPRCSKIAGVMKKAIEDGEI